MPWETPAAARKVAESPRPAVAAAAITGGKVLPWPIGDNGVPVVPSAAGARPFGRLGSSL
ncbi:MAG: hypothetical protein K2X35_17230 [Bryobacteraceae bacterium]|nr:hypothetical protein [Bryobacteraceae bacterium]